MPELPEVETVRRHLTAGIEGSTVVSVEVGTPHGGTSPIRPIWSTVCSAGGSKRWAVGASSS